METKLIVVPENEFFDKLDFAIERALIQRLEKQKEKLTSEKLFTINQVAHRLGRAHNTIKKLVSAGILKTTQDGMISEKSINEYLRNT